MSAHTPGWSMTWSMAGVWLVCTGPSLKDQLTFKAEDEAKARLVSAAPDLLEANRAAESFLLAYFGPVDEARAEDPAEWSADPDAYAVFMKLRSAIARATLQDGGGE